MTEADEGTAIADAEAFCRTLEAIARTLPKVALATHPALGTGAVGGAAVAPGDVGDHLRAARAFEAVVAGDTGTDRPATTTWYSAGKRHLHQPQLESLAELIAPLMTSTSKTAMKEQTTFRDDADADARGSSPSGPGFFRVWSAPTAGDEIVADLAPPPPFPSTAVPEDLQD